MEVTCNLRGREHCEWQDRRTLIAIHWHEVYLPFSSCSCSANPTSSLDTAFMLHLIIVLPSILYSCIFPLPALLPLLLPILGPCCCVSPTRLQAPTNASLCAGNSMLVVCWAPYCHPCHLKTHFFQELSVPVPQTNNLSSSLSSSPVLCCCSRASLTPIWSTWSLWVL